MTFGESISTCFTNYASFAGRAARSEYWWWTLFMTLGAVGTSLVGEKVYFLFALATLLPTLAVAARRLHDIDKSGWWQLVYFIPFVGWILWIMWNVRDGLEPNRF